MIPVVKIRCLTEPKKKPKEREREREESSSGIQERKRRERCRQSAIKASLTNEEVQLIEMEPANATKKGYYRTKVPFFTR
jgi:hypothetical protein